MSTNQLSMHPNERLISKFYEAFQKGDFVTMQNAYHPEARFTDPVFTDLSANEVKAMWEMLITSAKELKVSFKDVSANNAHGQCQWEAWYPFSTTGRKVHNVIRANFEFKDSKIINHHDTFDFWRWSRMALGMPGLLLGWTPIIKNKVKETARRRLTKFMQADKTS